MTADHRSLAVNPSARGVLLAGALALVASVAANVAVATLVSSASLVPRAFDPLGPGRVVTLTTLGVVAGVGVFAAIRRLSTGSRRTFRLGLSGLGLALPLLLFALSPRMLPVFAAAGLVAAAALFASAPRLQGRPRATFRLVAATMLACSYLPDLALLVGPLAPLYRALWQPNVPAVATLMLLHTIAAGVTVACLTGPWGPRLREGRAMA